MRVQSEILGTIHKESNFEVLQQIESLAKDVDIPLSQLAVAWILKNPLITAPIVGASKLKQIEENCHITEIRIFDEIYKKLNEITKTSLVFSTK